MSSPDGSANRLTTHILDLTAGRPGHGIGITLSRLTGSGSEPLVRMVTNRDGRTDHPLLAGDELIPGGYELAFEIGDYFGGQAINAVRHPEAQAPLIPFLDIVPIRFGVAAGIGHLHVALLVTPWSYTTYRGS